MKVFLVIVLALVSVAVVDCLQCYSCSSCNDPFKESSSATKVSCSGKCMKSKAKSGDVQVVSRSCYFSTAVNKCTKQKLLGVETEVCFCDTELCNGSSTVGTSLKLLLLLAAIVVVITPLTL